MKGIILILPLISFTGSISLHDKKHAVSDCKKYMRFVKSTGPKTFRRQFPVDHGTGQVAGEHCVGY